MQRSVIAACQIPKPSTMNHLITIATLLLLTSIACKKNQTKYSGTPSGIYNEVAISSDFISLDFLNDSTLKSTSEGDFYHIVDTFQYVINASNITLTRGSSSRNYEFIMIDASSFKIENLRASAPENPKRYLMFKKQ
jgi:hypothetical protein